MAVINGTSGADTLIGTSGDDEINGLAGNDLIKGSAGADKIDGGAGSDTVDYSASAEAINVDVRPGIGLAGSGGDAEGDTLAAIEKVIGSAFNDTFTAAPVSTVTFEGGAGDDVYFVNGGSVTVIEQTGGGNDEVRVSYKEHTLAANVERLTYVGTETFTGKGNASDNIITGGNGNDTLLGGGGADQFFGGAGMDTVSYDDSTVGVTLNLKTGVNSGIGAGDTYNSIEAITGSKYNDTFIADGRAFAFDGGTGTDTVDYSTSDAAINVDVRPGIGLAGSGGDAEGDTLAAIEKVIGSAFNDSFTAAPLSTVTFEGGAGDDVYFVNGGSVTVIEQAGGGNDEVRVSYKEHTLAANVERLTYVGTETFTGKGNASDNIITGGNGNDTLLGGGGADQFFGGAGMDTVSYDDSTVGVTLNLKTGVNSGIGAGDTYNSIEAITGSKYNDTFIADGRVFAFDGGTGTDTVDYSTSDAAINVDVRPGIGLAGTGGDAQGDTLAAIEKVIGSAFNDSFTAAPLSTVTFEGGAGDDVYFVNGGSVTVIEQTGGGNDEVRVSYKEHKLVANVERLTYVGAESFTGYGNASDNIITGGNGNDTLLGGGGADQFFGGAGMDTVSYDDSTVGVTLNLKTGVNSGIGAGDTYDSIEAIRGSKYNDTFIADGRAFAFDGGTGTDTVDYSTSDAAINVDVRPGIGLAGTGGDAEGDTLAAIEKVIGSAFNDTFTAAPLSTVTFEGGAGDDVYFVNGGSVTVIEQTGGGNDEVRVSYKEHTLAANVERLTYVGTETFTGKGNASDNIITGGNGNDTLLGGGGADQFFGGAGMDTVAYTDSTVGMNINLKTGVNSGIGAGDTYDSIEAIRGSNFNDTFIADGRAFAFDGGTGTDTVDYSTSDAAINVDVRPGIGLAGTGGDAEGDTLAAIEKVIGSAFNDSFTAAPLSTVTFEGGAGDDVYFVNGGSVTVVEQTGGGNDEVRVSYKEHKLAANVERLTYVGAESFTGYGNASDNIITGGNGNDTLLGGGGADQFFGGAGMDTVAYTDSTVGMNINLKTGVNSGIGAGDTYDSIEAIRGSNFNDTFIADGRAFAFDGGTGTDTVDYSTSDAAINIDVRPGIGLAGTGGDAEGDTLAAIEKVIGSAFNDSFTAAPLSTVTFEGGAGDDVYFVNGGSVTVIEQTGGGNDEVRVSYKEHTLAANVERMTYTGTVAFTGYGNADDNIITGGIGNDVLFGGGGADQFFGGAGMDTVSYDESIVGVSINLKTGVSSGIAMGDTYDSIEAITGSRFNDIFVGSSAALALNGGTGIDMVSYESSDGAVTIDLKTNVNAGDAAGDTFAGIEIFQGSNFADTFLGSTANDNFVGGAGADVFDGREGIDTVWYANNATAVTINLQTGVSQGGDAEGDVFINVESLIGTSFNDTLTGNAAANSLEGGLGNDVIYGGDGNDVIYGSVYTQLGPFAVNVAAGGPQADLLYGGNGDDTIVGAPDDRGTQAFGEAGNDTITMVHGMADGGEGNDVLTGTGSGFSLFGGAGADKLILQNAGSAFGGEGDDTYTVTSGKLVTIQDDGVSQGDTLVLTNINAQQLLFDRVGNDLYLHKYSVFEGQTPDEGVRLKDWFAGSATMDVIKTADGQYIGLPTSNDAFNMFG